MKDYLFKVHKNGPSRGLCNESVIKSELSYVKPCPHSVDVVKLTSSLVLVPSFKSESRKHWLLVYRQCVAATSYDKLFKNWLASEETGKKVSKKVDHDQLIRQWCEFGLETHSRKKKLEGDSSHCFC